MHGGRGNVESPLPPKQTNRVNQRTKAIRPDFARHLAGRLTF